MRRKSKQKTKTKTKAKEQEFVAMALVNPHAAGIDIGDTFHSVAVPEGVATPCVRQFGAMTCDLEDLVAWLEACHIDTVGMESTGVYWKPLFSLLIKHGFEVTLTNARQARNVTGRKDDDGDARWIQKLHSCGLLKSSYLPEDEQEALRTLVRHRRTMTQDSSRCILRMQKAMELMNIKLHTIISDLTGKTGLAIVDAILAGERNAENFLPLVDGRIKADPSLIVKSLQGNWRPEQLFTLGENYACYRFFQQHIKVCETAIEQQLKQYEASRNEGEIQQQEQPVINQESPRIKKKNKNAPFFNTRSYLERIHGVDVMAIYGLSELSALEILAETGTDMTKWATEKHFVSWLNLCPNNKITGGKLISSMLMKKKPNPASQAFRSAANAVQRSDHWLGDYFRRMKARGGNKYAIVATANKMATIYYKMVRYKQEFTPMDLNQYQQRYKQAKIAYLERKLQQLKNQAA
ncbi:MAG TPA: IS110 family transposase [Hanamia sp.]|nr:IS110 family transposase [Hanamia sp.]